MALGLIATAARIRGIHLNLTPIEAADIAASIDRASALVVVGTPDSDRPEGAGAALAAAVHQGIPVLAAAATREPFIAALSSASVRCV